MEFKGVEPRYSAMERYRAAGFWLDVAAQCLEQSAFGGVKGAILRARAAIEDGDRSMTLVAAGKMGNGGAA